MNSYDPEPLRFGGLAPEILMRLVRQAYADCELTEDEQILFGLRYGLLTVEADEGFDRVDYVRPMTMEEVVDESMGYTGKKMSLQSIARIIEMAEAKISKYVWEQVNLATQRYLDDTRGKT